MKLKSITGKARPGAFPLIEVLLVIVIIMLLAGSIVAFIIPQQASAEKKTARKNYARAYETNGNVVPIQDGEIRPHLKDECCCYVYETK